MHVPSCLHERIIFVHQHFPFLLFVLLRFFLLPRVVLRLHAFSSSFCSFFIFPIRRRHARLQHVETSQTACRKSKHRKSCICICMQKERKKACEALNNCATGQEQAESKKHRQKKRMNKEGNGKEGRKEGRQECK